jgi:hypothetical protein
VHPADDAAEIAKQIGAKVGLDQTTFSFAPPGLGYVSPVLPTACAVGCVLSPLRGFPIRLDEPFRRLSQSHNPKIAVCDTCHLYLRARLNHLRRSENAAHGASRGWERQHSIKSLGGERKTPGRRVKRIEVLVGRTPSVSAPN